ncbi:MAG: hypothetical protein N3A54_01160 [Patescibacteria group bacterium]|nr:hypothetical protein [Patescibacteria group bacterium]
MMKIAVDEWRKVMFIEKILSFVSLLIKKLEKVRGNLYSKLYDQYYYTVLERTDNFGTTSYTFSGSKEDHIIDDVILDKDCIFEEEEIEDLDLDFERNKDWEPYKRLVGYSEKYSENYVITVYRKKGDYYCSFCDSLMYNGKCWFCED